jgi:thiol-disulfide isomerase/thioredoxin
MPNTDILKIIELLAVSFFIESSTMYGQKADTGIQFESGLAWTAIQAKAKAEDKYIFVDCFATWCGPCKWMTTNVFSQQNVSEFMNNHFINVALQMDQTAIDSTEIKSWYAEAKFFANNFRVHEFPTYLFFSPDGQLCHRFSGATDNTEIFIDKVKDALNPDKQIYTLVKNWKEHKEDSIYLLHALAAATSTDFEDQSAIADAYITLIKNPITTDNLKLIGQSIRSCQDSSFKMFLKNLSRIDQVIGDRYAEQILCRIIFKEGTAELFGEANREVYWNQVAGVLRKYPELDKFGDQLPIFEKLYKQKIREEIDQSLSKMSATNLDWSKSYETIKKRYPDYDVNLIYLQAKIAYCKTQGLPEEHAKAALDILNNYGNILGDAESNDIIWDHIFNVTGNKVILSGALGWMRASVSRRFDLESYDTYANLLYKTGNQKDAVQWEQKCVELALKGYGTPEEFKIVLEKMKMGLPTWKDSTAVSIIYNN